ncbi:hypothetical protein [Nocardia asteroides]
MNAARPDVPIVEGLREAIRQWGGLGRRAELSTVRRTYLSVHALTILDTVLVDLAAARARLAAALAPHPIPDTAPGTLPLAGSRRPGVLRRPDLRSGRRIAALHLDLAGLVGRSHP